MRGRATEAVAEEGEAREGAALEDGRSADAGADDGPEGGVDEGLEGDEGDEGMAVNNSVDRSRRAGDDPAMYSASSSVPFNAFPNLLTASIRPGDPLCDAVIAEGFERLDQLATHVQALPYKRPQHAAHPLAVLREGCGTCSGKHQLLARVAQASGCFNVMLTVGLYDMNEDNTPGVGEVLDAAGVSSLPEAHCYLTVDHQRLDFTGLPRGRRSVFSALTQEHFPHPDALTDRKGLIHRQALWAWASGHGMDQHQAWALREACIEALVRRHGLGMQ
jgi:hypothetical protein